MYRTWSCSAFGTEDKENSSAEGLRDLSNHIVTNAVMVEIEFENNLFLLLGSPVSVADLNFVLSCQPLRAFTRSS